MKNKSEYTITVAMLKELDELYTHRENGSPTDWGILVSQLRQIRRLIEAGTRVKIEETSTVLASKTSFYTWAHGRYHMLEDGYDSWIGDDNS